MCDICKEPTLTIEQARELVAKGVEFLNADQGKGWEVHIDRDEFDIGYVASCIGGQLYGDYYTLRNKLGSESDAVEHGFSVWNTSDAEPLNEAWNEYFDTVLAV